MFMVVAGSLALGLAMVALSGYFTALKTAYGWGNLTRMAAHTAVGFIALSLGLLSLAWSDEVEKESWLPRWLPIPIAVAVITATLCLWQALSAAAIRIESQHPDLASVSNIATLMLVLGLTLAVAMATIAYLAQDSARRAREVVRTNLTLEEEIRVRTATEIALEAHRDNLELLVAARTREVEQAREEAEAANRAKSEFLSHMSHELRTPLNGILGYTQILQRDQRLDAGQHDSVNAIFTCGDHLLCLINDVLDLAKIEAGRLEVDEAPLDLAQLLQGVRDMVRARADAKGLEFRVQVHPGVPPRIISDAAKLRQILVNLLGNAVKFTASGSVQLGVDEEPGGILRFQVADTGIGIASDEIEAIFDPFKQVEAGKAAGGTGLGLAITRSLVDALQGTLHVRSEPGHGSTFIVALPLTEAPADVPAACDDRDPALRECRIPAPGQDVTVLEQASSPDAAGAAIPAALRARLRDAVRIKNLTAIKSVARELADDPSTAAMGAKLEALVRAFDFHGIQDLVREEE
jgi:signal transduction histidine kinase